MRMSVRCLRAAASRSVMSSARPTWLRRAVSQNSGIAAAAAAEEESSGLWSGSSLSDWAAPASSSSGVGCTVPEMRAWRRS